MRFLGWLGWPCLFTTGSHWPNRAGLGLRWCRSPTWPPKSHTEAHRAEFVFPPQNEFTPPPKGGRGGVSSFLGWSGWPCSFTAGPRWPNRAGLGLCWCRSPTRPPKSHTGPHRGGFGIHFLFLVCFCWGKAAKSCSSLQLTASWMGQIVNRSVPFLTSPDLVRTLVGSTSMSRLSSNCRIYFATVLALIPVDWLMRPMLGQH